MKLVLSLSKYPWLRASGVVRVNSTIYRRFSRGLAFFFGGHCPGTNVAIEREVIDFNIVQADFHSDREGCTCWQAAPQHLILTACNFAIDFSGIERNNYIFPSQLGGLAGEREVDKAQGSITSRDVARQHRRRDRASERCS